MTQLKTEFEKIKERIRSLEKDKIEEQYLTHQSKVKNKDAAIEDLKACKKQAEILTAEAQGIEFNFSRKEQRV